MKHKHLMACKHLGVEKCVYHVLENIYVKAACAVSEKTTDPWFNIWRPLKGRTCEFAHCSKCITTIFQSLSQWFYTMFNRDKNISK